MQLALIEGKKSKARKGVGGTCEICGSQMVAKCGPRVMHHWAHSSGGYKDAYRHRDRSATFNDV